MGQVDFCHRAGYTLHLELREDERSELVEGSEALHPVPARHLDACEPQKNGDPPPWHSVPSIDSIHSIRAADFCLSNLPQISLVARRNQNQSNEL
jgi:hypothetical protein